MDVIKQFNWVDIVIIILAIRIWYIAFRGELPNELFRFLGVALATYLSLHYYTAASDILGQSAVKGGWISLEFLDFICFILLVAAGYMFFMLIGFMLKYVIKVQTINALNRWGALLIGIGRSALTIGLVCFAMQISSISYLTESVGYSYMGKKFFKVAPMTYTWMFESITSKFMAREKLNATVEETRKAFYKE